jgi:two-component system LytT family response regulator
MSIRTVIVDDEELARRGVRLRLERAGGFEVVAECGNARAAVEAVRRLAPQLVFLDVQMPGKNGFQVIEAIGPERFPHVIFLTAHDQYAVRAFLVQALDYLLKPIDDERFAAALKHARHEIALEQEGMLGRKLAQLLAEGSAASTTPAHAGHLLVRSGNGVSLVKCAEIDWIEAAGDYVNLHAGKRALLMREKISQLETEIGPHGFARIHRSTIVNLDRIAEMRALDNGEYRVLLRDGTELKLSRSYRAVLDRLGRVR